MPPLGGGGVSRQTTGCKTAVPREHSRNQDLEHLSLPRRLFSRILSSSPKLPVARGFRLTSGDAAHRKGYFYINFPLNKQISGLFLKCENSLRLVCFG